MSIRGGRGSGSAVDDESGNSEQDWEIFDILCKENVDPACAIRHEADHLSHSLDLVTTLRSELAASTYKRDRLMHELAESKSALCGRETECESLRSQTARQSALIGSLQNRLQGAETRERNLQVHSESTSQTLQRDKRGLEEKNKELINKIRRLECDLSTEENHREQAKTQYLDLLRRLCICLGIDVCDTAHLTPDNVLTKAAEIVSELQRLRTKTTTTCEALNTCESELINIRSTSNVDKQRLQSQVDHLQQLTQELENRCRTAERDLQLTRDRLSECDISSNKLREELRGFESRSCRLQTNLDRFHNDRLQYLKTLASMIGVNEPCETLIKDKVRELVNDNQTLQSQTINLREQINMEATRHRESFEQQGGRLRTEEIQRCNIEERLEKAHAELQLMRQEHTTVKHNLSEYLVRLARALSWSECTDPPQHGNDTTILGESLLERAERLALHHEHHHHHNHPHSHSVCDKHCWEHSLPHHHHHHLPKLRRERSCHDLPLKESSAMYTLQRRVRVLREQVQRRDLHLELLRRKIALLEDGNRCKTALQTERDEALNRARRSAKQAERTAQQLIEIKTQLADVKAQLAEAADYKITALERARKIDELQNRTIDLENERGRLITQLATYKTRARSAVETSNDRRCRDEQALNTIRDELARVKAHLADAHHRLSSLQAFRSSIARLLHLRDMPEQDILQRLTQLCNAHQEFTLLSRRYESASPVGEHPCPRYDDLIPPSTQCRPISTSPRHIRRYDDTTYHDEHFDDEFDFNKKY